MSTCREGTPFMSYASDWPLNTSWLGSVHTCMLSVASRIYCFSWWLVQLRTWLGNPKIDELKIRLLCLPLCMIVLTCPLVWRNARKPSMPVSYIIPTGVRRANVAFTLAWRRVAPNYLALPTSTYIYNAVRKTYYWVCGLWHFGCR